MDTAKRAARQVSKSEQTLAKKIEEKLTVLWNDLPSWQRDNHYITSGYRPATNSYPKSFQSITYLHNETVNIWSHLIGALLALFGSVIVYSALSPRYPSATREDVVITTLAAGTSIVATHPKFRTPALRPFRALMFVAMGLSAVFPVLHGIRIYGLSQLRETIGLDWIVLQGLLYILGAGIYAARFPERVSPGKFDIWGSSHQIFHILVVMAAMAHLVGLLRAFDYEHGRREGVRQYLFLKGS
ncbi:hypothetical protein N0V90_000968 [Kalmusia sp. IMI 367209]|nr:hypothetical protein N0V90_000968 [Kalmusia sp. IMI 367209]